MKRGRSSLRRAFTGIGPPLRIQAPTRRENAAKAQGKVAVYRHPLHRAALRKKGQSVAR